MIDGMKIIGIIARDTGCEIILISGALLNVDQTYDQAVDELDYLDSVKNFS